MILVIALSLAACFGGGSAMKSVKDSIKVFDDNGFKCAMKIPAANLKMTGPDAKEGVMIDEILKVAKALGF